MGDYEECCQGTRLVTVGGVSSTNGDSEQAAAVAMEETLAEDQHEELELVKVLSKFSAEPFFSEP